MEKNLRVVMVEHKAKLVESYMFLNEKGVLYAVFEYAQMPSEVKTLRVAFRIDKEVVEEISNANGVHKYAYSL